MATWYRVNSPDVVAEVVEGEAVIVNLRNGMYYSLEGAGALTWVLLASGRSVEEAIALVQQRFVGDAPEIEQSIAGLIDDLRQEDLLLELQTEPTEIEAVDLDGMIGASAFVTLPVLNKYTDMEDLLLVDPVHGNIIRAEREAEQA